MRKYFLFLVCLLAWRCEAKLPEISPEDVTAKAKEMMEAHAFHKTLTPLLIQRTLNNYLENLDPNKTYFIEADIKKWATASDALMQAIMHDYDQGKFPVFETIHQEFIKAIERRHQLETSIDYQQLPKNVNATEFKEMAWATSEDELKTRLKRMRTLQLETAAQYNHEPQEKSLQRILKRQAKHEENMLVSEPQERQRLISSHILKATASAMDDHTVYFTPDEASQFMINVQQRLCGIGVQLRDNINGFSIVKIVEGGPAANDKQLKVKDRIIAVNGEPVVGMDIVDAVDLIRGDVNTPVLLTVIRDHLAADGTPQEEKLEFSILRGEIVLKESRFKVSYEPYGTGIIGYCKLHSFYQDDESSSTADLEQEIYKLKKDHHLLGLILDLRYNSGGLLTQAVGVTGLFINKGIVVSIKDENGKIQHLRNLNGIVTWDGPLIVLTNRMSASASEIVALTLQNYGRALIVGDDHTFGKGSYQTFTLTTADPNKLNLQGEYKVTRGGFFSVGGLSPQLTGVTSNIMVPGPLTESKIGEMFGKYPLENASIKPNFEDDLSDIPLLQREKVRKLYHLGQQEKLKIYKPYLGILKSNTGIRLAGNLNYQNFLREIKKGASEEKNLKANFGQNDLQLEETYAIMKDLILMMKEQNVS